MGMAFPISNGWLVLLMRTVLIPNQTCMVLDVEIRSGGLYGVFL